MKKRNMVMAVLAIITMGLAIPLSAQQSNQKKATAGLFSTDVDNYLNVNNYGKVNFDKWFGYLGGDTAGTLNLGYATKFGSVYLGAFYEGTGIWGKTDETSTLETTWDPDLQKMLTRTDTKKYGPGLVNGVYERSSIYTNNNIAALIGVAGMGIKLGFYEDKITYDAPYNVGRNRNQYGNIITPYTDWSSTTKNEDGSITYTGNGSISYEESYGSMIPYIQWGMRLNLGSLVLAPRVGATVDFNESKMADKYYSSSRTEKDGKIIGDEEISRQGWNNGYMGLNFTGGADLYLNNNSTRITVDYTLNTVIYDQSFDDAGRGGSVKGSLYYGPSGNYSNTYKYLDRTKKEDSVEISATEKSYMIHQIIPAFWKESKLGEDLKLGVLVKVPVVISNESESGYTDRWETEKVTYTDKIDEQKNSTYIKNKHTAGEKTEVSSFSVSPTVGVGASYGLIPNKFTVNAGINVNIPGFSSKSTVISRNGIDSTYEKYEQGSGSNKFTAEATTVDAPTTIKDSVQNETSWSSLSGSVAGGFVFSFNDNFALDLLAMAGNSDKFSVDLTKLRVLFSIKF